MDPKRHPLRHASATLDHGTPLQFSLNANYMEHLALNLDRMKMSHSDLNNLPAVR